MGIRNVAR